MFVGQRLLADGLPHIRSAPKAAVDQTPTNDVAPVG
jgi:hypothetical protein